MAPILKPAPIYLQQNPGDTGVPRPVSTSQVTFADLAEPHSQNVAGTFFGGALLSFADRAMAFCAMKHAGRPVVTKSIDSVEFNQPIYIGELVIVHCSVNYTGHTSMEVGAKVFAHNPVSGEERHTNSCYATFVALDSEGRPTAVAPVLAETDEQKRRYQEGQGRRQERLARRGSAP
ncbi:MAG: acyl-CoA thioesterase [Longimicrobiaceae bacterium]